MSQLLSRTRHRVGRVSKPSLAEVEIDVRSCFEAMPYADIEPVPAIPESGDDKTIQA
jgi:hypothetical protein